MKTLDEMRTYVSDQIEDDSTETLGIIDGWLNKTLKRLCDKYVWAGYSKSATITPDANGAFYVPPAFQGVVQVIPEDDTFGSFEYQSESSRRRNRLAAFYYMDGVIRATDGDTESNVSIANGATTITGTSSMFASGDVGEAVLIGNNGYEYEITAFTNANNVTIAPAFRGATDTYRVVLRPAGIRQFIVYDSADAAYTSDIILKYKVTPQPLYNDYDRPMIDADEALQYGALIEALRNEKYNLDAERLERDYNSAVADARQSETRPPRTRLPKGLRTAFPPFSFHINRDSNLSREF